MICIRARVHVRVHFHDHVRAHLPVEKKNVGNWQAAENNF
jgi:hypothetical protein